MATRYSDGIEPVTTLKSKSAEMIRRTRRTQQPVIITQHGKPAAVLQDIDTFERQRHALLLLTALAQGDADYRARRFVGSEAADREFRRLLKRLARE